MLLMVAGVPPPQKGGDARGWKRLLEWRIDFLNRALDQRLWDRRRTPR
jgi:hypothetical protein